MRVETSFHTLDENSLSEALDELCRHDPALNEWCARYGRPRPWWRPAGFATMARIIIEQQVSLASARAVVARLDALGALEHPERLLGLPEADLREAGLSRQKQAYLRALADELVQGRLRLEELQALPDREVRERLLALKGVGPWTAEVYLLMALRRADVWPASDLGLLVAVQQVRQLTDRPRPEDIIVHAERWRPYRSAAAWLLWHGYLVEAGLPHP